MTSGARQSAPHEQRLLPPADADFNREMAQQFVRAADLLDAQDADPNRVRAYRRAAHQLQRLTQPVSEVYREGGIPALVALPTIGRALALAIRDVVETGHWRWLDRLEGEMYPEKVLASVGGVGPGLAGRIHERLGIETLEELEEAAHDGRLSKVEGFGAKRVRSIRDSLAGRLANHRPVAPATPFASADSLLSIDEEYRRKATAGDLPTIAPRRFNPTGEVWLPVLHTTRDDHGFTAMFSNTVRAHELGRTDDWVVIYADAPNDGRWTVVTETSGPSAGQRVVRGLARSPRDVAGGSARA